MTSATAPTAFAPTRDVRDTAECGGARILDLAICMILAVTIIGLLMLAF